MLIYWDNPNTLTKIHESLQKDALVVTSTDTVLGLLGSLTKRSYEALNHLKQRSGKPYLILIKSADMLPKFIGQQLDEKLHEVIETCWPGPITLIFKAHQNLPYFMKSAENTIALRVPQHKYLQELLQEYDGLFSTSANLQGADIPQSYEEIDENIKKSVDLICLEESKTQYPEHSSTIIDCTTPEFRIVRKGDVIPNF